MAALEMRVGVEACIALTAWCSVSISLALASGRSMHRKCSTRNSAFRCGLGVVVKGGIEGCFFRQLQVAHQAAEALGVVRRFAAALGRYGETCRTLRIARSPVLPNVMHASICLELRKARIAGQSFTCAFQAQSSTVRGREIAVSSPAGRRSGCIVGKRFLRHARVSVSIPDKHNVKSYWILVLSAIALRDDSRRFPHRSCDLLWFLFLGVPDVI